MDEEQLSRVWHSLTADQRNAMRQIHKDAAKKVCDEIRDAMSRFEILNDTNAVLDRLDRG